jgi:CheY-like chemotaxis protein
MKKILVVDDEFAIAETLREILSWEGFDVTIASNGEQGLERMRAASPDLVIVDYMMPVMDGVHMLRAMKADEALRGIPTIMMTAALSDPTPDGPAPYLALLRKPFDVAILTRTVRRVLDGGVKR